MESKGVKFNSPPEEKIFVIRDAIENTSKVLPGEANGGLFAIVNETGMNAAIVTRINNEWKVQAYIGKSWKGSANYGVTAMRIW